MDSKLPNIIMIVMDTAAAKHMSLYGYQRQTTPNLERFAENSMVYSRCFAPSSWTLPSHSSLFTGLYPAEHGVDGISPETTFLNPSYQHIVSIMKHSGYKTYGITCNGLINPLYGNCPDFDIFLDYSGFAFAYWNSRVTNDRHLQEFWNNFDQMPSKYSRIRLAFEHLVRYKDLHTFINITRNVMAKYLNTGILECSAPYTLRSFNSAQRLIKEHRSNNQETPFFMFINVIENHYKYNPPKAYRRYSKSKRYRTSNLNPFRLFDEDYADLRPKLLPFWEDLYDDSMIFLDVCIGNFLTELKKSGFYDNNSIVIITSDHGEHFGEKGFYQHRYSLFNEILWIPLIISYPTKSNLFGTDDRLVSLTDLFSTILDINQSPFPRPHHSLSLLGSETHKSVSAMNLHIMDQKIKFASSLGKPLDWGKQFNIHKYALILDNNIKMLQNGDDNISIFNLNRDPNELMNLSDSMNADLRDQLLLILLEYQEDIGFIDRPTQQL